MSEPVTVTVRIPKELVKELDAKVEPRYRSEYIRQAIMDKLKSGPAESPTRGRNDEINELKARISALENAIRGLGKKGYEAQVPALLEVIALDETDRKIISYLVEHKSATTKELEKVVNLRRRMILERTKEIENKYEEKFGKPFLKFVRGKRDGKRQAWWLADS
ncbi:MAG: ribbon-helix-helix domain-containing protein [Promethearchaeati archaeon SRVP18_Atabeyarchaeia-1]